MTWRKLKFLSVAGVAAALVATLAVARAVRPSGDPTGENRSQMAPSHLQGNFACPPLVSAWDCEVIVNTFPMSVGNRGDLPMPLMRV